MYVGDKVIPLISLNSEILGIDINKIYQIENVFSSDYGDIYYSIGGIVFCSSGTGSGHPTFKDFFKPLKKDRKDKLLEIEKNLRNDENKK